MTASIIAIDGRPASPAMAAALANIDARLRGYEARKADRETRIAADRRIIARKAAKAALEREYVEGMDGAFLLFADMAAGRLARRAMLSYLIRARVALLDKDMVSARQFIRDATFSRRQHWTVTRAEPGLVILEPSPTAALALVSAELAGAA